MTGCIVALMGVTALLDAGNAQQPAPPNAKAVPTLDAEALRIPNSIHDTGAKEIDKSRKVPPSPALPNKLDLGQYDLEFKAGHTSEVNPRIGFDSGETSNLSKVRPGKQDGVTPDYFGLKLKVPAQ